MGTTDKELIIKCYPEGSALEGQPFNESTVEIVKNTETFLKALGNKVGELSMSQITYLMGNDENIPLIFKAIVSSLYPCKEAYYKIELDSTPRNGVMSVKNISSITLDKLEGYERVDLTEKSGLSCRLEFESKLVPNNKVLIGASSLFRSLDKNEYVEYIGIKNGIQDCFIDAVDRGELYFVIQNIK